MEWSEALDELSRGGQHRWRSVFDARAQTIFDGYYSRQADPSPRRAESPNAWFKREAYQLLRHYIEADQIRVFSRLVRHDARADAAIKEASKNPFKLGLLAMFSDDLTLTRVNRHVFGNQMLYAWAHNVPFDFLNPFLGVAGGQTEISRKLKERSAEPGFEHRFIPERLSCLD